MEYVFLGTGAGNGVPEFYCNCDVCLEAVSKPKCRRTRSAIAAIGEENILVDAPPELSIQLIREKITHIDYLFITHSHHDHSAGLGDLEIYTRFHRKEKLPVFMSRDTLVALQKSQASLDEWMGVRLLEAGDIIQLPGIAVTAVEVAHCGGALGFIFGQKGNRVGYLPDSGPLVDQTKEALFGIETLILDSTFWGENWYPESHLSVDETIRTARSLNVGTLYLTHLSMHYGVPVTCREIEKFIERYGGQVKLAYDGTRFASERVARGYTQTPAFSESRAMTDAIHI
ncbi:MBL fold metallo-hydrolase [Desulfosarcina ovata subsp. sediminis]|uniref:MBL fold metallo-hydrolase n=1 Tax=Desulfosarcina ovata subsp. sediminis TaxID=885957 RepID=A0A5K7ZPT2_9BACT|nr:MBL fold metallo-hydrolase [Desulfosarcina ovata]BBO81100.1 MBL fold metallo-hydrolase [Desulfosarcina ovata subsp. sediminis]